MHIKFARDNTGFYVLSYKEKGQQNYQVFREEFNTVTQMTIPNYPHDKINFNLSLYRSAIFSQTNSVYYSGYKVGLNRYDVVESPPSTEAELIFQSGFEPNTQIEITNSQRVDLIGVDGSVNPPNDWKEDLDRHHNIGNFSIFYQLGNDTMKKAEIMQGPINPSNNVLSFKLTHPNVNHYTSRVQSSIAGNNGLYEFSQQVRLFLTDDWNM